jgi:hypothetical protein
VLHYGIDNSGVEQALDAFASALNP